MPDPHSVARLRARALDIFQIGVKAAHPRAGVAKALRDQPLNGPVTVLAVGKAACAMAEAALAHIEARKIEARETLIVTPYANARAVRGAEVLAAGHPRPDKNGLTAARRVKALAEAAGAQTQILLLLSGGGSALLPCPIAGVSLADKQATNDLMLAGGLAIEQINLVRQNLSQLKGGGLARIAAPARVRTLILSDVIGDDVRAIASGPTAAALGNAGAARAVLRDAGLWQRVPATVRHALGQPERPKLPEPAEPAVNQLIGSNALGLRAMAAATGGKILNQSLGGDVRAAAQAIAEDIGQNPGQILLWGGETTVRVTGKGKGGRNQELALRVLQHLQSPRQASFASLAKPWAFLSAGSDGIDGPTDAAGGLVDSSQHLSAETTARLAQNDSYAALNTLGGLIRIGATGTNVADFQVFVPKLRA